MRRRRSVGSIYILGLLVVIGVAGAITTAMTRSGSELQTVTRWVDHVQAFYVAEAGLDDTLAALSVAPGQSSPPDTPPTALLDGSYWATVFDSTEDPSLTPGQFRIEAFGEYPAQSGQPRLLHAVTEFIPPPNPFQHAAFGDQSLIMDGNTVTDSYDSQLGAYGGFNVGNKGNVGTDGTGWLDGNAVIDGQVVALDPADVTIASANVVITGEPPIVKGPPVELPHLQQPAGRTCEDAVYGSGTVKLAGGPTIDQPVVHCYRNLTVKGGTVFESDGYVQLFLTGNLDVYGNATFGNAAASAQTQMMIIMTSPTGSVEIKEADVSGNTVVYGALYGPTTAVSIWGNVRFYGALSALEVTLSGNTELHYNEAWETYVLPEGNVPKDVLVWYDE